MALTDEQLKVLITQASSILFVAENKTADLNSGEIAQVLDILNDFLDQQLSGVIQLVADKVSKAATEEYTWKLLKMLVEAKVDGTIV